MVAVCARRGASSRRAWHPQPPAVGGLRTLRSGTENVTPLTRRHGWLAHIGRVRMEVFLTALGALLSVMNPLGTVPIFVGLTQEHSPRARSAVALSTALNVLCILIVSFFFGTYVLSFFGISLDSLRIAGGLIIASSGFALLTGKFAEHKGMKKRRVQEDVETRDAIALTPLAIPMIAGPGTISLLISYNQNLRNISDGVAIIAALLCASLVVYLVLRGSHFIVKRMGASGINALSRLIGFVVIAIGVEFVCSALRPQLGPSMTERGLP